MPITHIVVATDLSPAAALSYPHAAGIAQSLGARVTLLSVDELAEVARVTGDVNAWLEEVATVRRRALGDAEHCLRDLGVEQVSSQQVPGTASTEVVRFAKENGADLIVMTRHGHGRARHLLGSTTRRVLRTVECPVLLVHEPVTYEGTPADHPLSYSRAVVSTDLSEDSALGLSYSRDLARRIGADLEAVHVWRSFDAVSVAIHPEAGVPPAPDGAFPSMQARTEQQLQRWLDRVGCSDQAHAVVSARTAAEGIIERAIANGASLVIAPSHGKGALSSFVLGSTTERLAAQSPLPVLVLPPAWLHRETDPNG